MQSILFWCIVCAAAFYCAFILPFHFPLHEPVFSAAYTAGENIRVAAISVAVLSALVAIACAWFRSDNVDADAADRVALSRTYLGWGMAAIVGCTAVLGSLVVREGAYYADEGWFLVYLRCGLLFHRTLYRQFLFDYGPLLYFWPAAFIKALATLGVSMNAAYMISVAVMEALGIGLLFYIVKALPMSRRLKAIAFCLMTFGAFDMLLGINYAIVRCMLPFATIVFLTRQKTLSRALAVAFFGEVLQLLVSPEIGIAFGGAAIVYGLYRGSLSGWRWASVSIAALLGAGIFLACIDRGYMQMFQQAAKGGINIILEPLPYVIVLLIAVVVLAPLAVSHGLFVRGPGIAQASQPTGLLIAFFVAMLAMLAPAFARCDPLHAFVNGVGAYLLSFVAINRARLRWQRVWIAVVALTFAMTQFQEAHAFRHEIVSAFLHSPPDKYDDPSVVPAIVAMVGPGKVTMPFSRSLRMITALTQAGVYLPGYYAFSYDSSDQVSEERRVADMRSAEFALVPNGQALVYDDAIDNDGLKRWLRFGFTYPDRQAPFYQGALLVQELQANWQPAGTFGMYTMYRKIR